jgi:hypothetical protein
MRNAGPTRRRFLSAAATGIALGLGAEKAESQPTGFGAPSLRAYLPQHHVDPVLYAGRSLYLLPDGPATGRILAPCRFTWTVSASRGTWPDTVGIMASAPIPGEERFLVCDVPTLFIAALHETLEQQAEIIAARERGEDGPWIFRDAEWRVLAAE